MAECVGFSFLSGGLGSAGGYAIGALITGSTLAVAMTPAGLGALGVGLLIFAAVLAVVAIAQAVKAREKINSMHDAVYLPNLGSTAS